MDYFIGQDHAIRLIREARRTKGLALFKTDVTSAIPLRARHHFKLGEFEVAGISSLSGFDAENPACLIVPAQEQRFRNPFVHSTVISGDLPAGSYLRLGARPWIEGAPQLPGHNAYYVTSPALCMLSMADLLQRKIRNGAIDEQGALARLASLALEMCGTYARDPEDPSTGRPAYKLPRVSSNDDIGRQLSRLSHRHGLKLALKAAEFAVDGSASPMESLMLLMLSMPARLGGLELTRPDMNRYMSREDAIHHITHFETMRPDLSWPDRHVAIEYNGDEDHSAPKDRATDARRIQDYQTLGWKVLPATFEDVRTQGNFNRFAWHVIEALDPTGSWGRFDAMKRLMADGGFLSRQARLLSLLLPPRKTRNLTLNEVTSR